MRGWAEHGGVAGVTEKFMIIFFFLSFWSPYFLILGGCGIFFIIGKPHITGFIPLSPLVSFSFLPPGGVLLAVRLHICLLFPIHFGGYTQKFFFATIYFFLSLFGVEVYVVCGFDRLGWAGSSSGGGGEGISCF